MKILSWNIQDGGAQDIREYDNERKSNADFKFGEMYKNHKWNKAILRKAGISEQDIINNVESIAKVIINKVQPDVVILQEFEYQYKDFLFPYFKEYYIKYNPILEAKIARNGVLIAVKSPLKMDLINTNVKWKGYEYDRRNFLEAKIDDFTFLGVHIPVWGKKQKTLNEVHKRRFFWSKIKDFSKQNSTNTFILGDFNTVNGEVDKEKFSLNWFDLGEEENKATYYDNRIDYIFCSNDLQDKIKGKLQVIPTNFSDHNYLILDVDI